MNETYLYPYSAKEARERNELSLWRESHRANIACRDAIEDAIRRSFDGMHLDKDCTSLVLEKYGYKRTAWVLANTLHELKWDGRFSHANIPTLKTGRNSSTHLSPTSPRAIRSVRAIYAGMLLSMKKRSTSMSI